jgi:hypothetical protein
MAVKEQSPKVNLAHDKQMIELWHDDGEITLTKKEAAALAQKLNDATKELELRKAPPAPKPFMWSDDVFAECGPCDSPREGELLCTGGVGGHEFYLKNLFNLRDWINDVLDYHRNNGCKNLMKLEGE